MSAKPQKSVRFNALYLIGSQALRLTQPDPKQKLWRRPVDYDFAGTHFSLSKFVSDYRSAISNIEVLFGGIKVKVTLADALVVEFEMTKAFPSYGVLNLHPVPTKNVLIGGDPDWKEIPARVVTWFISLVIKMAQLHVPQNWQKAAGDVVKLREALKLSDCSLATILASNDPNGLGADDNKLFFHKRQLEALAIFRLHGIKPPATSPIPSNTLQRTLERANGFRAVAINKYIHGASQSSPENAVRDAISGVVLDWKMLSAASKEDQLQVFDELIRTVALHFFVDTPKGQRFAQQPHFSGKSVAQSFYRAALQSVCTQILVPLIVRPIDFAPPHYYQSVASYDGLGHLPLAAENTIYELQQTRGTANLNLQNDNILALELPTDAELNQSAAGSQLFTFIVDNLGYFWTQSTCSGWELVVQRSCPIAPIPALPLDVWRIIVNSYVADHMSLAALEQTSHFFKDRLVTSERWAQMLHDAYHEETRRLARNKERDNNTKELFAECLKLNEQRKRGWAFPCSHCKKWHHVARQDLLWMEWERDEHELEYCQCPHCDCSSWNTCEQYQEYVLPSTEEQRDKAYDYLRSKGHSL